MKAKLVSLTNEFNRLHEVSSDLPFWNTMFWTRQTVTLRDWILVDAWYRSRSLDLPQAGHSMVPVLDMVNHSRKPNAYYDENNAGDIEVFLREGVTLSETDEITISYGEGKSVAEMIFSYGFADQETPVREMTLPIGAASDDPLAQAKFRIFNVQPTLKLSQRDDSFHWESPFIFLLCLNEEDGLEFCVLQKRDGGHELRLFWQQEDATARANDFESLIEGHEMIQVFRLRAVALVQERVETQLELLLQSPPREQLEEKVETGAIGRDRLDMAQFLRSIETELLEGMRDTLEQQVCCVPPPPPPPPPSPPAKVGKDRPAFFFMLIKFSRGGQELRLLSDEKVLAYLESVEDTGGDGPLTTVSDDEEDDFS